MEGASMLVNKRRKRGPQVQNRVENYEQDDSGFDQDGQYNEQEEEVQFLNFQGQRNNNHGPSQQQWRLHGNQGNWNSCNQDDNVEETQEEVNLSREHIVDIREPIMPKAKAPIPTPPPPYPQRLAKKNGENQFKKTIDMIKSLPINVSLVEALEQMLGYAMFMKDLVTKKRLMNCETIKMTHQVSAIVHSRAPKLEDLSAFTIPCTIGNADFAKALYDLGTTINLMPYSMFKTLGIGQPRPTSMGLQMADCTIKRPLGIIDNVFVCVDKLILPADFVILDCEVDYEVPIILGRFFLATVKGLVDVEAGKLFFRAGDEKVIFHVYKSVRQPNSSEVCSFMNLVTGEIIDDASATMNVKDNLEVVLLNLDKDEENEGCRVHIGGAIKEEESSWMDFGGYLGYKPHLLHAQDYFGGRFQNLH
ncbi:uncharacterized protein [Nicotiana sylvestris]|uniref:uncharacterized protein n=1 Tax=Nicotiana sylvestris TaxID=4096 RepID=UPI00388C7E1B